MPHALIETFHATVQMICSDICGESIGRSVEYELRARDPVRAASHDRAEIPRIRPILLDRVAADHDVGPAPLPVGSQQRHDDAAVIGRAKLEAVRVLEREDVGYGRWGTVNRYA